ncbi:beta-glucosidase BglX [Cohnella abietis]|uniref:beta-glucosidase n=1 Tax=Cohnella abietis TaxID=2507935 RepID=A0A3T1DCX9_9BACL|nr:beta-glucosidase BglX [Cohnella abietis]BBI35818.1 beta-glucosidase [Cohnella abietis]
MTQHKWTTPEIRKRAEELLAQMSLEDKAGQMTQYDWGFNPINPETGLSQRDVLLEQISEGRVGSIFNISGVEEANQLQKLVLEKTSSAIPLLIGRDVIHGYRTVFPITLGQASAWNPELARQTAAAASREAHADGVSWVFAPMIDVTRDPRWGRIAESLGEDPYLTTEYAKAWVEGAQTNDGPGLAVASCPKHFAGYGLTEAGRDYNTVDLSDRVLREVILPPFKEAVESGALSIMASFNEINGIPVCANRYLLTTILREEWGFEGIAVSDYNSIQELIVHGVAADEEEACLISIKAGLDMDMSSGIYIRYLPKLVREGKISEQLVDQAVLRILAVKLKLGLFEHPFIEASDYVTTGALPEAHLALARQSARESIVLLRNERNLLPLNKAALSLAVIGPLADSRQDPLGCWAADGRPDDVVTVLDGIKSAVGANTTIHYAAGCDLTSQSEAGFAEALDAIHKSDIVVMALGETFEMSGEARCRTDLDLPGGQRKLVEAAAALGKPIVVLLLSGRPLTIPWLLEKADSIVQTWHLGVQSGHAIADILFGDYNPSGRLTATFPQNVGQIPIYYYRKKTGRPPGGIYTSYYIDSTTEPLYPFGYGLSYTSFKYESIACKENQISKDDSLHVSIDVTNTGSLSGEEVVQCYIRDESASVTQPLKKLIAFRKIKLNPGETATVEFQIKSSSLAIIDADMNLTVEPGYFTLWVGPNSSEGESLRFNVVD